ncbi:RNA-directed DNA polymerase, eukaryota, reverse transcriptase zinc-binding domain protein [Tanacetum coccineum]
MEAWSIKGISAIASSIGKPIIMDDITAKMCAKGEGRLGFARVLIEIDAGKKIKNEIELMHKGNAYHEGFSKILQVDYAWKPPCCPICKVFGHEDSNCMFRKKVEPTMTKNNDKENVEEPYNVVQNRKVNYARTQTNNRWNRYDGNGFIMNRFRNKDDYYHRMGQPGGMGNSSRFGNNSSKSQMNKRYEVKKKDITKGKEIDVGDNVNLNENGQDVVKNNAGEGKSKGNDNERGSCSREGSSSMGSNVGTNILGSNRFTLLESIVSEEDLIPNVELRKKVDELMENEENVINENYGNMNELELGLCNASDKQKEVKKLILEEGLQACAIIETHVKHKNIKKTCENVYGNWEYTTNSEDNNKGCRIMLGWNENVIQTWVISKSKQYMLVLMETMDHKSKFYCSVIYASNSGVERKKLWRDLEVQKTVTAGYPWVILGDFNVTLQTGEHSSGSSTLTGDMIDFQECVNNIELDDLHCEGFYYTWTKSLKNPQCRTLKKLDRIMVNEAFMDKFQNAYGVFLTYMISDHSPIILRIPNGVLKRKSAFRFSNFITEKNEFLPVKLSWKNGNIFERAELLRDKVKKCQRKVDSLPHDKKVKEDSCIILKEYQEAIKEEYSLLCQKAKVEWLKDGDKNTDYFYKTIKERVHRGRIMTIMNDEGIRFENEDVAKQIVSHFEKFLGETRKVQSLHVRSSIFTNKLNTEEASMMVRQVSNAEIKNAMFEIDDSKAPGLDGYTARFYKSAWSIVGKEVILAVREFFDTGKLLGEVNATLISLVPKIHTPDKFSININGERVGYFRGGRGLRQGDPISPYLFTLVMEVLTLLIKKNIEEESKFKYHQGCKKCKITHLCFADDLLVFCHGDRDSVRVIKKSLDEFSGFSGLLPNMQKSTIFFRGLSYLEQAMILDIIPFSVGRLLVKYLGVPLITKQISSNDCKPLIEKVKSKISNWKNKSLSYAGRLQLIAAILSSMQIYWAAVFLLPKQVIYEINKMLKGFLWCQGDLTKGKAKVSWDAICKPKDQGGLGLKNLKEWNEILLVKQLWNVATKKDTLWVKWIHEEKLKGKSIWNAQVDYNSSVGWKNILSMRDKVRKHIGWKLGNGKLVNVWHDQWCGVSPLSEFISSRDVYDARLKDNCTVKEVIQDGRWVWPNEWSSDFEKLRQIQIPVLKENCEDCVVWITRLGKELKFKIGEVWKDLCRNNAKVDWCSMVWFPQAIPRHAFVLWLATKKRLMTQDRMALWRPNDNLKCALCGQCEDSHNHLFFSCEFSKVIWKELNQMLNVRLSDSLELIINDMIALPMNNNIWSIIRRLVIAAAVYYVWQERNDRLFKNEKRKSETIISTIKESIRLKLMGMRVKESRTVNEVEKIWNVKISRNAG